MSELNDGFIDKELHNDPWIKDMESILNEITWVPLPEDQYINKIYDKHQIYIHHTASSANPYGVLEWWKHEKERVGTAFIIAGNPGKSTRWKDGEIIQCFSSAKSAWHLGLKQRDLNRGKPGNKTSSFLNLNTIGIEMTCWGQLTEKDGKFFSYAGVEVPKEEVIEYPELFRSYRFYHRYTSAQIESLRKLLIYLCDKYNIDRKFKGMEMFDIDKRALRGESGIWSHVSVRPPGEKWDCHPQPELIEMLKSL